MSPATAARAALSGPADLLVRSPGRINIIGEHTDYTGGLVLPASIDKALYFAVRRTGAPELRLTALDIDERATLPLPLTGRGDRTWVNYLTGIGIQFQDQGHFLPGLEIAFGGDLPQGAGMSSSAALEGGMAFLLNEVLNAGLDRPALAALCKRSSNTFMGIPSGIMDQFASLNGRAGGPILLNCHTLAYEPVVDKIAGYELLLINSMVSHNLGESEYPLRVAECARALEAIQRQFPEVTHLSAATEAQLAAVREQLDVTAYRRAGYVIAENHRVRRAINAMESGSPTELGTLLNATHAGLRDNYEVSCAEIDFIQARAVEHPGVAGARLLGGGFGGCVLVLVEAGAGGAAGEEVLAHYGRTFGIEGEWYAVRFAGGTSLTE